MWYAVSFALIDSLNALLIAVIVAIGIVLPKGQYRKVAPLLIAGDWFGVFVLALLVMYVFDGLQEFVQALIDGPWLGLILIIVGAIALWGAWRSSPGDNAKLVNTIMRFLGEPSILTFLAGFVLGVVQSATSSPFYGGIAHLSAGDYSAAVRYGGMLWYASLALSLPTLVALLVGLVRSRPESRLGKGFEWASNNTDKVGTWGGYIVAILLILIGLAHL